MRDDERAVSVTVGYVLNFAVAAMLISGLLIAGSGLIESQTQQTTADELAVIGHQLADELSSADRLVRAGDVSSLAIRSDLPQRTAGGGYTIALEEDSDRWLITLRTTSPDVTVTVPVRLQTDLREETVSGGPVRIEHESGQLVVTAR